ncbi:MAG: hypothetical protein NC343_06715 [Muribaculum sp.]|nr:hypothetical protein [Muribaculaceae bacterium]MCM1081427.1 hypothetical protein [Muribaculum sp.]
MKRVLLLMCLILASVCDSSAVTFRFKPGTISNATMKQRMERNASDLLTEIDAAGRADRNLNLAAVSMEPGARTRLTALWENLHFICEESTIISMCLEDAQGYQIRGIHITVRPKDSTYKQSLNRELTISFSKTGVITGVRPAMESQETVRSVMGEGGAVTDLAQRREILKFVEDFRCYYNERDIASLNKIFSEDAIIITGSVLKQQKRGDGRQLTNDVRYKIQNKQQYMTNLNSLFQRLKYLNVEFDKITVVRHGSKPYLYGVTLHQKWTTNTYSDNGWLFLLWDFKEPTTPQIHVRSWQPDEMVATEDKLSMDDFFLP